MKARWRARVSASYRADGCSSASRQSRIMLKTITALALRLVGQKDAPERLLIVTPPCQSEIKRTLRHTASQPKNVSPPGSTQGETAHSLRMVNTRFPQRIGMVSKWWTRRAGPFARGKPASIENLHRFKSIEISGSLTSTQTLAIYRRLLVKDQLR